MKMTGRLMVAAVLAVGVVLGASAVVRAEGDAYTTVPLDQVKAEVTARRAALVDVREQREWDQGHVRGALFIPLSQLMAWDRDGLNATERAALEKALPRGAAVYCHCAAGGRAVPAGEILAKLGYDARPLRQGYQALIQAGFPRATAN
jgi:rhodanese-related sulfurtransferase